MRVLKVYLWKEWREQRWTLAALAGGLVVAMAILAVFLPAGAWRPGFTYDWVGGVCVLTALFTVGSDLLSREMRRERLQFLQRAPAGLRTAFLAKLIAFVAVMVGAAAFGIGLAAAVAWVRTGALPEGFFEKLEPEMIPALVGVVLWVFAVSAWVRTGAMALPSALLLLAACCLPCWFVAEMYGLSTLGLVLGGVSALAGAVVTALWSFVVGAGRSRPRRFVVLGGLGVAALFFSPSWAFAAVRYAVMRGELGIRQAWIGAGGRYAWLNAGHHFVRPGLGGREHEDLTHPTALLVDLESGDWRDLGRPEASWLAPHREWARRYAGLFGFEGCTQVRLRDLHGDGDEHDTVFLDGRTALPVSPGTPLEAPELGVEPADFGLEEFPGLSRWYIWRVGLGYRLGFYDEEYVSAQLFYDPLRGVCVNPAELEHVEEGVHFSWVCILPGRWLAMEQDPGGQKRGRVWLDPETGKREPCDLPIGRREHIAATIDDGTLLMWKDGGVSILDPETGERRRMRLSGLDGEPLIIRNLRLADWSRRPVEADSRSIVLLSLWHTPDITKRALGSRSHLRPALLDLAAGRIEWPPREWELRAGAEVEPLSSDGPRMIGIEDEKRIVRYDFDAATREVIFSIDQLE